MATNDAVDELVRYLSARVSGQLEPEPLIRVLVPAWHDLDGSGEDSTTSMKLSRMEDPRWEPPVLRFELERHGGTVNGSSRAEVHFWEVDVEKREAHIERRSRRQLNPMDARLDVKALIDELTSMIDAGADDPRLVWKDSRSVVRVEVGRTIPATNRQTTAGRRKRFAVALGERAAANSWEEVSRYTFRVR